MSPPRIEISRIRLYERTASLSMRMKDELVWRKEIVTMMALDAFGSRTVVSGWNETAGGAVRATVVDLKFIVLRQFRWCGLLKKRFAKTLCFAFGDHSYV